MISRCSSVSLAICSLVVGVGVGFSLGRGGSVVSAQVGSPARGSSAAADPARASEVRHHDGEIYDQLAKEYEQFAHVNRMFEMVARAVAPTVVHIVAEKRGRHEESQRIRKFEETGSGVIVRSDKLPGLFVLTNHHVVEGGKLDKIRIYLNDGRTLLPRRIWSDPKADVAVLKLDRDDLPAARLGDSDTAVVGSWVLALGSPFGLMHSVSQGIISARGRHVDELQDVENQDFLQTDAAINPGNSGGPLVNMKGEVIGINNSIASNGGGNEGVGFSIPINLARWIMNELVDHGHVVRGALGVDLQPEYTQEAANKLGLDRPRGALIDKVHPESPAARGGLHDGDVILNFAGVEIHDLNHLINTVSMTPVGKPADVLIWRDRQQIRLKITVGDRDRTLVDVQEIPPEHRLDPTDLIRRPTRPVPSSSFALGLELVTLNPHMAIRYGLPESTSGALIVAIDPQSSLATICQAHDVIAKINERPVQSAEEAVKSINERTERDQLILTVDRRGQSGMERYTIRVP
ncbi:MAG: trypsin-like peptidase domain-containing protein [Isosphaeraceae bacterium]